MYKLLIVDDEELVRKAIVQKLDWASIGFVSVMQAEDGEQALEIALQTRPDVVLTDVRMPFMDGLELADKLTKTLPETKVIVLSGHDEFEYAQEAIKIGVLDYILKPIRSSVLMDLMTKVKNLLDEEHTEKEKLYKLKNQLHQSLPLLKEKFLNSLVNHTINEGEIQKKLDYLDIKIPGESFIVCISEIDDLNIMSASKSPEDIDLLNFSVMNILSELVGTDGIVFSDYSNRQVMIFSLYNTNQQADNFDLYSKLEYFKETIERYLKITVTIGIGSIVQELKQLNLSYSDALNALEYKILMGKNKLCDSKDLGLRQSRIYYPIDTITDLLSKIKLESWEEVRKHIDFFFNDLLLKKDISPDNIRIILSELISGIQRTLMELSSENSSLSCLDFSIYGEIARYETLEDIKQAITRFIQSVCRYIHTVRNSRNLQIIDQAKQCINEKYFLEELSLNYVAGIVSVSPGYLSILFRKETDETFVEYLTRVRMEKAKELFKTTGLKAYEIAYKVGYSDPHYFSLCFKKYTGLTPSDYKNSN